MVSKSRSADEILGKKPDNLSPTQPAPDAEPKEVAETSETSKTEVERVRDVIEDIRGEGRDRALREQPVENFDNSGNGVTDNMPLDWNRDAPAGTVIYGTDSAVPSENAVVSGTVSTAVYAGENEFDDKGLADVEEPGEPETEPPAKDSTNKDSTSKDSTK